MLAQKPRLTIPTVFAFLSAIILVPMNGFLVTNKAIPMGDIKWTESDDVANWLGFLPAMALHPANVKPLQTRDDPEAQRILCQYHRLAYSLLESSPNQIPISINYDFTSTKAVMIAILQVEKVKEETDRILKEMENMNKANAKDMERLKFTDTTCELTKPAGAAVITLQDALKRSK